MNKFKAVTFVTVVLILLFLFMGPYFIVKEGDQALVVRFGKIVRVETEAGLKLKTPLIDKIVYYPKRIQPWDGDPQLYPTEENQYIWVDITARWQIENPKLFYERLGEIIQAHHRLDQVLTACARDVIAVNPLREAIRSTNLINQIVRKDVYKAQTGPIEEGGETTQVNTFTQVTYEPIKNGRVVLSGEMLKRAAHTTPEYGIKLVDLIIRQIKYSDDITQTVYRQMIKERNQIAQAFRSDGEGEKAKWLGKMDKELRTIQSEAERTAKEIKAKADAEALDIRNKAYSQSPEFADYWMAIMQYQKVLPKMKKTFSTDSEFFKYLYNKGGK
ncbi:MAG: protease modulator HflC [Candidatus Omnitrophota bacterium]